MLARRRLKMIIAAALGIGVAIAMATIAASDDAEVSVPTVAAVGTDQELPPTVGPPREVPEELASRYALLRRAAVPADAIPRELANNVVAGNPLGPAPALARLAGRIDGEGAVYAVPAADHLCVAARYGPPGTSVVTGCNTTEGAVREGVPVMHYCTDPEQPQIVLVVGLVPDGAHTVELVRHGDVVAEARASHNAYVVRAARPSEIRTETGSQELPLPPVRC